VAEVLACARGARLMMADPPWLYANSGVHGNAADEYGGLSEAAIAAHLDAAYDCAGPACRLATWYTWPKDAEWNAAGGAGPRWGARVTGGAWLKTWQVGVGYHWRGQTEPVALFTRGAVGRPADLLLNGYASTPGAHSEKPVAWLRARLRAWTEPGDLVLDLYAGLAPMARACLAEGRAYIGAEIDPARHAAALGRLMTYRDSLAA
jgi:hypothetical protein